MPEGDTAGRVWSVTRLHYTELPWMDGRSAHNWRFILKMVSLLAGRAAQHRYNPRSVRSWHAQSDLAHVADLIFRLFPEENEHQPLLKYLEARASNLIAFEPHWQMIEGLVKELLKRGTLSGEEVLQVFCANMASSRQADSVAISHRLKGRGRDEMNQKPKSSERVETFRAKTRKKGSQ